MLHATQCQRCWKSLGHVATALGKFTESRTYFWSHKETRHRVLFAGDRPCYAVRLCKSPQCPRMAWNRDVNASINMLHLVLAFADGQDKPAPFCRGQPVQH